MPCICATHTSSAEHSVQCLLPLLTTAAQVLHKMWGKGRWSGDFGSTACWACVAKQVHALSSAGSAVQHVHTGLRPVCVCVCACASLVAAATQRQDECWANSSMQIRGL
eukprot:2604176-Amphidinium_carterae.1